MESKIIFAAVGDVHGHIHIMVKKLQRIQERTGLKPDFVLQVGDFQPVRSAEDLESLAVPLKYRSMGDFQDFCKGWSAFPFPLWFIGGNHEPYGLLDMYPNGTTLLENCHYLGRVGRVELGGLSISGLSGIYSKESYHISNKTLREPGKAGWKEHGYFTEEDVDSLLTLPRPDILLLHDWPADIGCTDETGRFAGRGNQMARTVVDLFAPKLVLCGHQHHYYSTELIHQAGAITKIFCLDEIRSKEGSLALFSFSPEQGISCLDVA